MVEAWGGEENVKDDSSFLIKWFMNDSMFLNVYVEKFKKCKIINQPASSIFGT